MQEESEKKKEDEGEGEGEGGENKKLENRVLDILKENEAVEKRNQENQ